jgi:hypothetical protein
VDTIPVDVLAEGVARLMEHPGGHGRVFHLAQGIEDRVAFAEFIDKLRPVAEALNVRESAVEETLRRLARDGIAGAR